MNMENARRIHSVACPTCGRRPFLSYFRFSIRSLLLLLILISLLLAIPVRSWQNSSRFETMKEKLQLWGDANISTNPGTRELRFNSSGFSERTDRNHVWYEFVADRNPGQPGLKKYSFEIHVSLAPFPSLEGPITWALDRSNNQRLTQGEINEILNYELNIEPIDY